MNFKFVSTFPPGCQPIFPACRKMADDLVFGLYLILTEFCKSIFLHQVDSNTFRAFIFTMEEELDFAGHPVIGAAALLHDLYSKQKELDCWIIQLNAKSVIVKTMRHENYYQLK